MKITFDINNSTLKKVKVLYETDDSLGQWKIFDTFVEGY